jgi:hypothetical protein
MNLKKRMSDKRVRCVCGFLQEIGKYLRSRLHLTRFMIQPINRVILTRFMVTSINGVIVIEIGIRF